jgi:hypothetical protein
MTLSVWPQYTPRAAECGCAQLSVSVAAPRECDSAVSCIYSLFGDESRLNLPPRGGRSEMGRGRGKHLLFLDTVYGTRDLILASSCRWLRTRRKMKGRHMGGTTVVVGV